MMTEAEARRLVIEAGHRLVETKLIARTWGNISARISEDEFVITPSGRAYETLRPEDLVKMKISTLEYEGNIKPSSEKGIHASAYALRSDCGFIIHTHQFYASAVGAEGKGTPFAPCAAYALSGTKKLAENLSAAIKSHPGSKSFLMTKHGALCLGRDYEEAFSLAEKLEEDCRVLFEKERHAPKKGAWIDDYAQMFSLKGHAGKGEDPAAVELVRAKNEAAASYVKKAKRIPLPIALLEHGVYKLKYSKQKDKKS